MLPVMATRRQILGRASLLVAGLGVGGALLFQQELAYQVHETQIATRPIFDPPGLKYAQIQAPERQVRGWVGKYRKTVFQHYSKNRFCGPVLYITLAYIYIYMMSK